MIYGKELFKVQQFTTMIFFSYQSFLHMVQQLKRFKAARAMTNQLHNLNTHDSTSEHRKLIENDKTLIINCKQNEILLSFSDLLMINRVCLYNQCNTAKYFCGRGCSYLKLFSKKSNTGCKNKT